uniref:Uncharacterized protein n=1 Tax=Cacopsylla melanoneura TaxID=428564 RepID=A0A8D8WE68_9HEMI
MWHTEQYHTVGPGLDSMPARSRSMRSSTAGRSSSMTEKTEWVCRWGGGIDGLWSVLKLKLVLLLLRVVLGQRPNHREDQKRKHKNAIMCSKHYLEARGAKTKIPSSIPSRQSVDR